MLGYVIVGVAFISLGVLASVLSIGGFVPGGVALIALGALAAASGIVAKRPNAQVYIDKLVPYQGGLGIIACLWGSWIFIKTILYVGWFSHGPIWWLTFAATGAVPAALGLLMGYSLLTKFIFSHSPEAVRRGEQLRLGIVPYQVALGYVAIVLGIWTILLMLLALLAMPR